jgi:cytochrome c556
MKSKCMGTLLLCGMIAFAQAPPLSPAAGVRQLMLDLIYPSSNDILLAIYRGGPPDGTPSESKADEQWAAVRRAALTLAESGNLLTMPGRAHDQADWMKDAKLLEDAGNAAYKAALAKDGKALAALAGALDASCTTCHKQYRPNVFPRDQALKTGGSK